MDTGRSGVNCYADRVEVPQFVVTGGRPCLDLIATLGRRHAQPVERLPDPSALGRWLVAAGLLTVPPAVDAALLDRARLLRESVHRLVRYALADQPPSVEDLQVVNAAAAQPDLAPQLVAHAVGSAVHWTAEHPADAALATVARDAVLLLTSPQVRRVKECHHPDCSLLFLDNTQSGRRRWCSMDRCGNLIKIAGYRARRSTPRGP